ncbi:hypothetical protein FPG101_01585 [Flavobacterium psychrophilum FPG101]|nr:hypothetical protein FPG101_01585 [Flavobacterium psychrophilum FPG101]OJH11057.1 hypothetical protein FPG103_12365 [Flavobacterium psychrophilum]
MVIVASSPDIDILPVVLFTIITPIAPAFCANFTLIAKEQPPRLITAILPANSAAFIAASPAVRLHAFDVSGVEST